MNVPKPKKPKGYKKEQEVQKPVEEILEGKAIKFSEQTDTEKEIAHIKKEANIQKEELSILKERIAKAKNKKKKVLEYIDEHFRNKPGLCVALANFIDMFIEKRGTLTVPALELLLDDLRSISTDENEQINIVNNSTKQSYTKFYSISNSQGVDLKDKADRSVEGYKHTSVESPPIKSYDNALILNDPNSSEFDEDEESGNLLF